MDFVKPRHLSRGDTVAGISLSCGLAAAFPQVVAEARRNLAVLGLTLVDAPHALRSDEWLYANPRARAADLRWALENPEVQGIFGYIGGYESVRILEYVDQTMVATNPKVLIGFSDLTTVQMSFLNAGVTSFYGPNLIAGVADHSWDAYGSGSMMSVLSGWSGSYQPAPEWTEDLSEWASADFAAAVRAPKHMRPAGWWWLQGSARATGHLVGGCMDVLEMMKGTRFWPSREVWSGAVLLFDTSEEVPDPVLVEYWLRNYATQGILDEAAAMIFARPRGYTDVQKRELAASVTKVLREVGRPDMPVVMDVDCGHVMPMMTMPLGATVAVDASARTIELLEPGVV